MENPNLAKLSSMYMYAWKQGVKTTYYLRSRAKTSIQKTTIQVEDKAALACSLENPEACEACQ
jgi:ribonucleoside-diphosphate reductase alpha chain